MFVKVQRGQTIKKLRVESPATFDQLLQPFRTMKLIGQGSEHGYCLALSDSEILIDNDQQLQQLLTKSQSSGRSGTLKLRITERSSQPTSNRTSEEYQVVPSMEALREARPNHNPCQSHRKLSDCTHQFFNRGQYHSEEVQLPSERWFDSDQHHYNQSLIESEELRLQEIKLELLRSRENIRRIEESQATDIRSLLEFAFDSQL